MGYSQAAKESSWAGSRPSSLKAAGQKDPALARTLHAVDSAVGAQQAADRGRREADAKVSTLPHSTSSGARPVPQRPTSSPAGSQIEMADMSGRSSPACSSMQDTPLASEAPAPPVRLREGQPTPADTAAGAPDPESNGPAGLNSSDEDANSSSAVPNGHANGEHVIQMPHEDLETSSSRCDIFLVPTEKARGVSIDISTAAGKGPDGGPFSKCYAVIFWVVWCMPLDLCLHGTTYGLFSCSAVRAQRARGRASGAVQQYHFHLWHVCPRPHRVLPAHCGAPEQHYR